MQAQEEMSIHHLKSEAQTPPPPQQNKNRIEKNRENLQQQPPPPFINWQYSKKNYKYINNGTPHEKHSTLCDTHTWSLNQKNKRWLFWPIWSRIYPFGEDDEDDECNELNWIPQAILRAMKRFTQTPRTCSLLSCAPSLSLSILLFKNFRSWI